MDRTPRSPMLFVGQMVKRSTQRDAAREHLRPDVRTVGATVELVEAIYSNFGSQLSPR
jgi:hypothetical protein